jgi:hypothetical protein
MAKNGQELRANDRQMTVRFFLAQGVLETLQTRFGQAFEPLSCAIAPGACDKNEPHSWGFLYF